MTETPLEPNPILDLVKTGTWLDEQVFRPTEWVIPGIIPEGFGLLTGPPKIGKSWFALSVSLGSAAGGKVLGRIDVKARPVLYLALEDGDRRLQDRSRHLLKGEAIPEPFEFATRLHSTPVTSLIAAWLAEYTDYAPLVMLDTLGKVLPAARPGESAYQRDYRIGSQLKELVDEHPGSSLVAVHHIRKAVGDDWMDSTSGTNGLNGAADFTLNIARDRNSDSGLIRVTGRDVEENEYAVTNRDGEWVLDGDDLVRASERASQARATSGVGDDMARVVDAVHSATVDDPMKTVDAHQIAGVLGMELGNVRRYLSRAVETGRVTRPKRGHYACVRTVSSVRNNESDTQDTLDTHGFEVEAEAA